MKLLRMLAAAALALGVMLASAAETDPPAVVGRLNHISGPVSFAPAEANDNWSVADLNRPITTGDRLWTDSSARAELHVGSLAIRMGSQTSLDVLALDEQTLQLRLAQGDLNLRVRRLAGDKLLEIATPNGAVVVRQPGSYRIDVDPSGSATTVTVRRGGEAEVFTGTSSFAVADNQEAEISSSGQALFAARAPDDFDHWAADRDQREDRVLSTRYVPEEMTGYEDLDQYGAWRGTPDYGSVWVPTSVPAGWAPYRNGHWVWISPWGWTWVDDAPWGFAPFHYGRWIWLGSHWAWAPGHRVARPVYAPALVAFIGGSNFSVSVGLGSAPAIGWVPLGWREPYRPWYRASHAHVRNVNITHVTNVTSITNGVTNVRLVNRNVPSAVTVVSRENFIAARRADRAALRVDSRVLAAAPVTQGAPVATPARTSLAAAERGATPPIAARTRETVAINTPRAAIRQAREDARNARRAGNEERPRVRVVNRGERVNLQQATDSQRPGAPAPQAQTAAQTPRVPSEASKGGAADAARTERSPGMARPPATPQPAQARSGPPASDNPALQGQAQWNQQAERRAPAPPPDVSRRPTFDRDMRPSTAQARREQRQAERQERQADRREQPFAQRNDSPRAQAGPPDTRVTTTPRPAQDAPRAQQLEQQQQQAREEQARMQQTRQREVQQQNEERQRAQQQREQQQAQQRQQQAQAQQAAREQQVRQREAQQQAEQQRVQQLRAEQQARGQQAREQQTRQREAQRQNEERQRAQQQAQQRAQQAQAQQAAREQQARQEETQRAQHPQQQRAEQERENRRERQRPDRDRG